MYVNDVEEFALKTYIRKYLKIIKTLYFDKKAKDQEYAYMRIGAIDVLRGIFVVAALFIINQGMESAVSSNLAISTWHGMTFADLVLPYFVLIMGMSIPFFVKKNYADGDLIIDIVKRVFIRFAIIFIVGLLYSVIFMEGRASVRLTGPYQLLAIDYLLVALAYIGLLNIKIKNNALTYVFLIMAIIVSCIMTLIAFINGYSIDKSAFIGIDRSILGGFMSKSTADPEGLMAILAASPLGMIGLSIACIFNKKPIKNKRYKKYYRPAMVRTYGFSRSNLWIDIKSWLNPKSIGSILSNYYRINDELKKLVNLALLSILMLILSHISQVFIPLNRNVFSLTFVLRMAEYAYFLSMLAYLLCDIMKLSFGTGLLKRVGLNAVPIILLDTAIHELIKFIHIKSIYTGTWLPFNNWFTTDFILPITGTDYASACYSVFITVIWVLLFNLLEKYKLKINI